MSRLTPLLLVSFACANKSDDDDDDNSDRQDWNDACEDTCDKIYVLHNCNIERPGMTTEELLTHCTSACEQQYEQPGDVGDYDPFTFSPSSEAVSLENEAQAELWMQCIEETACALIDDGYCAPVW